MREKIQTVITLMDSILIQVPSISLRWQGTMPRYAVGHLERVAAAVDALASLPSIVLAGSAYGGVGLPDCVAQGRAAAVRVQEVLGGSGHAEAAERETGYSEPDVEAETPAA